MLIDAFAFSAIRCCAIIDYYFQLAPLRQLFIGCWLHIDISPLLLSLCYFAFAIDTDADIAAFIFAIDIAVIFIIFAMLFISRLLIYYWYYFFIDYYIIFDILINIHYILSFFWYNIIHYFYIFAIIIIFAFSPLFSYASYFFWLIIAFLRFRWLFHFFISHFHCFFH